MQHISRRTAMAGLAAMGALGVAEGLAAKPRRTFFERVGLPIGLQTYTLGEGLGPELEATFARLAEFGYGEVELPNLYGRTPKEVRNAADQAGLAISSMHLSGSMVPNAPGLWMTSPPEMIAETAGVLGLKRVAMPIALFPANFRPAPGMSMTAAISRAFAAAGEDPWKRTAALLNERASALKPYGVGVGYHNHNIEFAPIGRTNGWNIIVAECDRKLVKFEIDTGWIATAGLDPVAFLRRHRGRVAQLHVKDVAAGNTLNYAIEMKPAEVGAGVLDWQRILPAAYQAGVRHFYVEQEAPFAIPRIEAARRGIAFLRQLRA